MYTVHVHGAKRVIPYSTAHYCLYTTLQYGKLSRVVTALETTLCKGANSDNYSIVVVELSR